jgi:F-type H+-transporting ATPase subunit alpha
VEVFKQNQYHPMPVEKQVLVLYVLTHRYFAAVNVEDMQKTEREFLKYIDERHSDITDEIREKREISDEVEKKIKSAIEAFMKTQEG